jgi:hypothetical protein
MWNLCAGNTKFILYADINTKFISELPSANHLVDYTGTRRIMCLEGCIIGYFLNIKKFVLVAIIFFHILLVTFLFVYICIYISGCLFCVLLFNVVNYVFLLLCLCILIFMFKYFYCSVSSVLCNLFHCVVLCIVFAQMCTVLLPPGVNRMSVNEIHHISYGYIGYIGETI